MAFNRTENNAWNHNNTGSNLNSTVETNATTITTATTATNANTFNTSAANSSSNAPKKIIRNLALKRVKEVIPLNDKVKLDRVLGLTVSNNTSLDCDPLTSNIVYPAGCVLVFYNIRKNKQTHIINSSKKPITACKFSCDGKYIVTGECGHQPHVRVWDGSTCEQVAAFAGHKFGINCVAFSPNNKYVVSVGSQHDMIVNVWDWKNNLKIASNKVSSKVKALSFASNGTYFVTVGNRHVKFWYLEYSKTSRNKFESLPLMGRSAILGDQRNNYFCDVSCGRGDMSESTFAITKSGLLCEFNNRRLLDKWVELRTTSANCISISDQLICVGCAQGIVRCFNPRNLHFICTLPRPHSLGIDIAKGLTRNELSSGLNAPNNVKYADCVAITLDEANKIVSCIYGDRSIYFWTISNIKKVGKLHSFLYHSSCIWAIETYPNLSNASKQLLPFGTFLTCSSDDTIRIWNLDTLKISPDSCYIYKRNIFSAELLKILYMDPDLSFLCDVDINPNENSDKVDTTYDGKNGVRSIRVSPDGRQLASGDRSGNIRIFDLELQQDLCKIEAHDSEVLCLEYSNEQTYGGKSFLASASRDRLIHIFDVKQQYSFVQTMDDHSSSITSVKFVCNKLNNLQMISCGADKSLIFRKGIETVQQPFNFMREHHVVGKTTLYDMEIDSEQTHVLTACQDRMIRVYDVITGKNSNNFRGSQGDDGTLIKIALDPSGTYIAASCTDKSLYIYDYASGECIATTSGHSELITGLKFSQNGRNLLSVSGDGCIFIWQLPIEMVNTISIKLGLPPVSLTENNVSTSKLSHQNENEDTLINSNNSQSSLYRFNLRSLPLWAKKQMVEELSRDSNTKVEIESTNNVNTQPKGRWAQRVENNQNLVKPFAITEDANTTYLLPKKVQNTTKSNENEQMDDNKNYSNYNEDNIRYRNATDSSSASGSFPHEDDDEVITTDSDNHLYHGNTFTESTYNINDSIDTKSQKARHSQNNLIGKGVVPSISVPNFNELHSDDDDSGTTGGDSDKSVNKNLYISTENLDRIDQREKYLKNTFENLDRESTNTLDKRKLSNSDITSNRLSISSKYHSKTTPPNSTTTSSSLRASNSTPNQLTVTVKPPISKRREELTAAISQARKKLETLGWKGTGLSNSKSVANLREITFDAENKNMIGSDSSEAIRRSISLSDLSLSPQRKLLSSQVNLNQNFNGSRAPIWDNNKLNDPNSKDDLSRSTSINSLNKIDSRAQAIKMKNKSIWATNATNSSQNTLKPTALLSGRASAPLQQIRKNSYATNDCDSSEDELSSSSDERIYPRARPGTPPKPNILKQIRRSSTSQATVPIKEPTIQSQPPLPPTKPRRLWSNDLRSSKSEFNLANIGRETPIKLRSNSSSSGSGLWATPPLPLIQNEKVELLMTNPSTIPLTHELCQLVIEELTSISKYAARIYERALESGNVALRDVMADGISRAHRNLQSLISHTHLHSQSAIPYANIPNDSNYSLPPESMNQAITLLQQYSDRLLNLVEEKISKNPNSN